MASDLMLQTAEELSELIRTRTVSSRELLDEAIRSIRSVQSNSQRYY